MMRVIVRVEIFISCVMILSMWNGFRRILSATDLTAAGILVSRGGLVVQFDCSVNEFTGLLFAVAARG